MAIFNSYVSLPEANYDFKTIGTAKQTPSEPSGFSFLSAIGSSFVLTPGHPGSNVTICLNMQVQYGPIVMPEVNGSKTF